MLAERAAFVEHGDSLHRASAEKIDPYRMGRGMASPIARFELASLQAALDSVTELSARVIEETMTDHSEAWDELYEAVQLPSDRRRLMAMRDVFHLPKDVLLELRSYNASVSAGHKLKAALRGIQDRCESDPECLKAKLCAAASALEDEFVSNKGAPVGSYVQSRVASVRDALGRSEPPAFEKTEALDLDAFKNQFRNFSDAFTTRRTSKQPARQRRDIDEANVSAMLVDVKRVADAQAAALKAAVRRYETLSPPKKLVGEAARIEQFLRDAERGLKVLRKIADGDLDSVVKVQNARAELDALPDQEDEYEEIDGLIQAHEAAASRYALQCKDAELRAEMKTLGMEPRGRQATITELERALAAHIIASKALA